MNKLNDSSVGLLVAVLLVGISVASCSPGEAQPDQSSIQSLQLGIPDEYRIGGFAVGPQSYTFNRFTVMEAIENAARMGGRTIELYPGQRLSPERPDTRFDHNADDQMIAEVRAKLEEHDILPVNFGVVGLPNDEARARVVFEFARKIGVRAVTSEPAAEALDLIERLAQEYDIAVAIHNHAVRPDNPEYRIWDPNHVRTMLEGRDARLGAAADIGHWIRSGIEPVEGLRILEGRLISLHMTDVDEFGLEGEDVIMGTGVGDMAAVLDELKRQDFGGHISIEYEANWDDNVPDASQNIGFIRGWAAARGY